MGGIGKVLISLGLLMFGFVGYQLWGTGLETELAQRGLEDDFERMLAEVDAPSVAPAFGESARGFEPGQATAGDLQATDDRPIVPSSTTPPPRTDSAIETSPITTQLVRPLPISEQRIPDLNNGDALARLEIPAIGVNDIVVAGISVGDLKKGPGHFPDTPLPGQLGNSAIAGHRTTYGAPFFDVDQLDIGDEMIVTTLTGRYVYTVESQQVVSPSAYEVVSTTDPSRARLTLVSCEPKWTARQRIIIRGVLDDQRSGPVGEPLLDYGRSSEVIAAETTIASTPDPTPEVTTPQPDADIAADRSTTSTPTATTTPAGRPSAGGVTGSLADTSAELSRAAAVSAPRVASPELADAFGLGWFSDPAANLQVGIWGLVLAAIACAAWRVTKKTSRNLVGALAGIGPFIVALYFFYQNVNRLLPPSL